MGVVRYMDGSGCTASKAASSPKIAFQADTAKYLLLQTVLCGTKGTQTPPGGQ